MGFSHHLGFALACGPAGLEPVRCGRAHWHVAADDLKFAALAKRLPLFFGRYVAKPHF